MTTIREDAANLLVYCYQQYRIRERHLEPKEIIDTTGWTPNQINQAIDYLREINALKINLYFGEVDGVRKFHIRGLTPKGIDMVEQKEKSKITFGFEINILGFKFSWEKSNQ